MKVRFAIPIALALAGIWFFVHWCSTVLLYYPKPDQKSAFINAYSPKNAVANFRYGHEIQAVGGESAAAGYRFVKHGTEFQEYYAARKDSDGSVMAILEEDILRQLSSNRAHFLNRNIDARGKVRIDYQSGQVLGSITIDPITKTPDSGLAKPADFEDKLLHIAVNEKWFPKGIPSEQISGTNE